MSFSSLSFIYFSACFFPLYFLLKGKARIILCLISSYIFYGWWDARFLGLIALTTLIAFYTSWAMEHSNQHFRKLFLGISVVSNLGILALFKYFGFFTESMVEFLSVLNIEADWPTLNIILPVGISFYTFQALSYTIDRYYQRIELEESLLVFATYVALFPQLVAGPIVRASKLLPQFKTDHPLTANNLACGLEMVAWGLFLKIVLADTLGPVVDMRFDNVDAFNSFHHLISVIFFAFQIYGDFAGYSLIAIGLGRIMGFDFGINFNRPYFSTNFSEFWNRWHISLSSWLRDYLYIPLGGNREGKMKSYRNLMVTMLLGGLWHGASWNFVFWGFLHGLYLIIQRLIAETPISTVLPLRVPVRISYLFKVACVFSLTCFAWIFFRSSSWDDSWTIVSIIAQGDFSITTGGANIATAKGFAIIGFVLFVDAMTKNRPLYELNQLSIPCRVFAMSTLVWLMAFLGTFAGGNFIYFQF